MQDRIACYLLGQRGIDKYLAGRLFEDTLLDNLAREWASLPTSKGKGFYGGQQAAVEPSRSGGACCCSRPPCAGAAGALGRKALVSGRGASAARKGVVVLTDRFSMRARTNFKPD